MSSRDVELSAWCGTRRKFWIAPVWAWRSRARTRVPAPADSGTGLVRERDVGGVGVMIWCSVCWADWQLLHVVMPEQDGYGGSYSLNEDDLRNSAIGSVRTALLMPAAGVLKAVKVVLMPSFSSHPLSFSRCRRRSTEGDLHAGVSTDTFHGSTQTISSAV
ncbi:hypothetical protein BKA61DRAFT_125695 [Leptodontidium sp. MPI-SDFR-AT-0119]|nr:hypothetical protein BKA61DRAFT_125695 [Leptodontidium sp. MPI-SDFR-AT-0119]